jgi:UDP-N-acetylmuramate--alanine ligase
MNEIDITAIRNFFFIGIAGDGMSAIAQYLSGLGKKVSGSDRQFSNETKLLRQVQLEEEGITCYQQDKSGINDAIELVVVSTAIEPTVPEYIKALELNIPVVMRSDLLATISKTKKTIAVGGTSGKSTVTAMIYHILNATGCHPSLISGAGLVSLQEKGKIGNAVAGKGDYLVIEADESDGSIVKYAPEIGILLNIDKDHKETEELKHLFLHFKKQSKQFIVNRSHSEALAFSQQATNDFGRTADSGFRISDFEQKGFQIKFKINGIPFELKQIGMHNAENAAAAVAACSQAGISVESCAESLKSFKGIYRRHQIVGMRNGITLIDDYAHNPAKLSASIKACQLKGVRLFVWFQPHGFQPTRFLKEEFIKEIAEALRSEDEIYMSEIYYAGGTVEKDISSEDLIKGILLKGKKAEYLPVREALPEVLKLKLQTGDIVLLTGARDPSLSKFAEYVKLKLFG